MALSLMLLAFALGDVRDARAEFERGAALRDDPNEARRHFAEAARLASGDSADDFLIRGNAEMQMRRPALALQAFRGGLRQWPNEPRLQRQLSRSRESLQTGSMPIAFRGPVLSDRVATVIAALFIVLTFALFVSAAHSRRWPFLIVAFVTPFILFLILLELHRDPNAGCADVYLVTAVSSLRAGNGPTFDEVSTTSPLAAGQEVRVIGTRGTWSHVECPDGTTGWLPSDVLIR
jgi:hypothetical protein